MCADDRCYHCSNNTSPAKVGHLIRGKIKLRKKKKKTTSAGPSHWRLAETRHKRTGWDTYANFSLGGINILRATVVDTTFFVSLFLFLFLFFVWRISKMELDYMSASWLKIHLLFWRESLSWWLFIILFLMDLFKLIIGGLEYLQFSFQLNKKGLEL